MYENRSSALLSRRKFFRRVVRHVTVAFLIILFCLSIGVIGYHYLGHLTWIDSLLNSSMILGGMGPVDTLQGNAAKLFASIYALFSGLILLGIASVLIAPFVHRIMHKFHLVNETDKDNDKS